MNPRLILVFVLTLVVSIVAMVFAASFNSVTAQNSRAPSAPTGLTARAVFEDGRHRVKLSWDVHPADQRVTGWQFTIWDPETGDDRGYVRLGNRDHTFTAIDDVNVQPATTYVYTVHAINSHGHGDFSRRVTVTTLGNQGEPIVNTDSGSNAPTGLTAENDSNGVLLEWDDPRDPTITGYRIWRRIVRYKHGTAQSTPIVSDLQLIVDHTGAAENHFFDSDGLEANTRYAYGVSAISSTGKRAAISDEVEITRPRRSPQPPDQITGVTAMALASGVHLSWDNVEGHGNEVTDVFIERELPGDPTGGHFIHLTNYDPRDTSYTDVHGLRPDTTYIYRISASNGAGRSERSDPVTATTWASVLPTPSAQPPVPANPKAEAVFDGGHHRVIVAWDKPKPSDQILRWRITRYDPRTDKESSFEFVPNQDPPISTYHDTDVGPGTTYSYRIIAISLRRWSDESRRVTVTTSSEPEDPGSTPISIEEWFETRPPDTGGFAPTSAAWLLVAIVGAAAVVAGFALRRVPMAISILRHKQRR